MKQSLTQSVTSRVLLALTLAVASFVGFTGIAEAATCTSCHATPGQTTDIRPVESAFRNITTGGFKGSHVKHIPAAAADANACTSCHAGSASYDTKHRNGFINVTSATAPGLSYSKGAKFPQQGNQALALGTCSTASCHNDPYSTASVVTPAWGAPAANCTACHTTQIDATGPATGSHANTAGHAVSCTSCHAAGTSATAMPSANHNDGNINIVGVGYPATVAKHAPDSGYTTCSAASCHADPYSAGNTVVTPAWGSTNNNCAACHIVTINSYGPNTGSHLKHNDSTCTDCHAAGTTASAPGAGHRNGYISVKYPEYPTTITPHASGSYDANAKCSTASCHADPYSAGTVATPVWGTSAGCAACHTGVGAFNGTGSAPATGSHNKHMVLAGVACNQCHDGAAANNSGGSTETHAKGTVNVSQSYTASPVTKHAPGTYTGTCSTSCHSASTTPGVTPVWNVAATCASCHAATPATGTHSKHLALAGVSCGECHSGASTTSGGASHYSGTIEVSNSYLASPVAKHATDVFAANATCSTVCHSATTTANSTPKWGSAASCASCHEATPTTGKHSNHLAVSTVSCADCHTGASATSGGAGHLDGKISVSNNYPITDKHAAGVFSPTATCTTACHSATTTANTTPSWIGSVTCNSCHEATPTTGKHTKHLAASGVTCASCHTGATANSGGAGHYDGNISVSNGYPTTAKHAAGVFSPTATCTTACHSATTTAVVTPAWSGSVSCNSCHEATPTTGTHTAHINSSVSCGQCHIGATAAISGGASHFSGKIDVSSYSASPVTKHTVGTYTGTCSTSCHGSATTPVWGTTSTSAACTKCHGTSTATVDASNKYVVAPSDASATDKGKVSSLAKVGAHQTHLQLFNGLSQQGTDAQARCEVCHVVPTAGNHATGSAAPTFSGLATTGSYSASYTAGSCSVYCHNPAGTVLASNNAGTGTSPSWTNTAYLGDTLKTQANCGTCHKSPGDVGFTSTFDHSVSAPTLATDCTACHGHDGGTGGSTGWQHMDGVKAGNKECDACHGYPPLTATQLAARTTGQYVNAKVQDYDGGAGQHKTHLLASVKSSDGFTPCLPCHPSAFHNGSKGPVSKLFVNVNDAADMNYRFDSDRSKRYNVATQSCSNVSCHYQPTPAWTSGVL
jgi:predicted CxxxxCH...CXXCH cytochrome family protein